MLTLELSFTPTSKMAVHSSTITAAMGEMSVMGPCTAQHNTRHSKQTQKIVRLACRKLFRAPQTGYPMLVTTHGEACVSVLTQLTSVSLSQLG
jgi:hypothetical protein